MIWLECGTHGHHDINLDCGGGTFEEVVAKLAALVKEKYKTNIKIPLYEGRHGTKT